MPPTPAQMLQTERDDFFTRAFLSAITGTLAHAAPKTERDIVAVAVAIAEMTLDSCHVWKAQVGMRADVTKRALLAAITGTAGVDVAAQDVVAKAVHVADLAVRAHRIYVNKANNR